MFSVGLAKENEKMKVLFCFDPALGRSLTDRDIHQTCSHSQVGTLESAPPELLQPASVRLTMKRHLSLF